MSTPARYEHIDLTAPAGVLEQLRIALDNRGAMGDGLEDVTIREAERILETGELTWHKASKWMGFWARNERFLDAEEGSPAWFSAKIWGGRPGRDFASGLRRQKDAADEDAEMADMQLAPAAPSERIEGSAKNRADSASGTRGGIEITEQIQTALENKRDEHNAEHGDDPAKKADLGALKAVYRRGAGAFSTSHRADVSSRNQWAMARVNAFLYLLRNGRPEDEDYITDYDLLPLEHPKYSGESSDLALTDYAGMTQTIDHRISGAPDGRKSWVCVLVVGDIHHKDQTRRVERRDLEQTAAETRRALYSWEQRAEAEGHSPYRPPVLINHTWGPSRYGDILDCKLSPTASGKDALWLLVEWGETTWPRVQSGEVAHVSVGIKGSYTDDAGETYGPIVRELSMTTSPVAKNIGTIQDSLELSLADATYTITQADLENPVMEEMLQQILMMLEKLVEAESDDAEMMDDEDKEMMDDEDKEMMDDEEDAEMADELEPEGVAPPKGVDSDAVLGDYEMSDIAARLDALAERVDQIAAGRRDLNLSERGDGGRAPAKAPKTHAEKLAVLRARGVTGVAAARAIVEGEI